MFYSHIALVLMTAHYHYSVRQDDTFNLCLHLFYSSLNLYKTHLHVFNRHAFYLQWDLFLTSSVDETICCTKFSFLRDFLRAESVIEKKG